ncbi:perlucin-like protein isoform X2 [Ruditapes philippinarum]|uniref:perlucin-like protein isoform X2 n=1 Tax=Ruditapes philippinarum TaxID=129788 RepID=UPI00295BF364|nr:perlucin-like protein isoform X2 [Ruditapes philippinarum]
MNSGIILLFLQFCSMTDEHIIIYGTGGDSQRPVLKWDGESANLEREIEDVKEDVISINKQIGVLKNRVEDLETRKESSRTPCLDGWIAYGGSCYYLSSTNVNYAGADEYCKSLRAHLVHVEDKDENTFLKTFMQNHSRAGIHYWIGITDIETENVWKLSGENKSSSFFDWGASQEPSGTRTENCARFAYEHQYKWGDVACTSTARPACEENWKGD